MLNKLFKSNFFKFSGLSLLLLGLSSFQLKAETEGVVTADTLNVRVMPDTKFTVVDRLKKGSSVEILSRKENWFEIKAPAEAAVWVSSAFLKNGVVLRDVMLRSGPSVAYAPYGVISAGDKVDVLDGSREHWLRISPPKSTTAWVSAAYVEVPEDQKKKIPEYNAGPELKKEEEEEDKPGSKNGESEKTPSLPFSDIEPTNISMTGYVLPLEGSAVYVTHALALNINGEYYTIAYLHSSKLGLKLWESKKTRITGKQRWVKGWKRPVIEVEMIDPEL